MKIVKGDGDTIRFENLMVGETFYPYGDKTLYLRLDDYSLNASARSPAGVNLETSGVHKFSYGNAVVPVKAEVVVQAVGRVACGYNPK